MKIAFGSDIHLEFGPCKLLLPKGLEDSDIDVLILAGDISTARSYSSKPEQQVFDLSDDESATLRFWNDVTRRFKKILYIPGNHDFYHGHYSNTLIHIKDWMVDHGFADKVTFSDKILVNVENYRFVGATLWTDFNKSDPRTLMSIQNMMADFHLIAYGDKWVKFSPYDALYEHFRAKDFIKNSVQCEMKTVVFTHHGPTRKSIHEKYSQGGYHEAIMNGGYVSQLEEIMLDNDNIKYWIHGHTHEDIEYVCGNTRVMTNPRGYYLSEVYAKTFMLKVVELA